MTSNLPEVDSVWGVVNDTSTWLRVNSVDDMIKVSSFVGHVQWYNPKSHNFPPAGYVRIDSESPDLANAKLEFLQSKGLTVGTMRESGKDPYLAYVIQPGSELCDLETVNKLVDAEIRANKYEAELERCAGILQRVHPMGAVMGIGLLNVAHALAEVVDGASESALRELHAAIERGGLDISCCMDCSAPVVCIPDGLPMCEGCATKAIESGKGLPELTDADRAKMNAMPADLVEQLWNKEGPSQPVTVEWLCEIGGELIWNSSVVRWRSPSGAVALEWDGKSGWWLFGCFPFCSERQPKTRGDVLAWLNVLGIVPNVTPVTP